jgi:hypothetical protein
MSCHLAATPGKYLEWHTGKDAGALVVEGRGSGAVTNNKARNQNLACLLRAML